MSQEPEGCCAYCACDATTIGERGEWLCEDCAAEEHRAWAERDAQSERR